MNCNRLHQESLQPEGLRESSRGSSEAKTPGTVRFRINTLCKGARPSV